MAEVEATAAPLSALDRFFKISERGSNVQTEILGGVTTFVTMAYIIVVNPAILSFAGIPVGASTVATILTAVFGCFLMGIYANRPIAVAPYMGENAFIAFGMAALGIGWQLRLGAVFVGGLIFLAMSLVGLRSWLANSISTSMKASFAVGIGLFLTLVGMYETGLVTSFVTGMPAEGLTAATGLLKSPDAPLKIGNLHDPQVLLAIFGFLLMTTLLSRRVHGAILIGIVATALLGYACGQGYIPEKWGVLSLSTIAQDYDMSPIFLKLDIAGVLKLSFLPILLTLFLMGFLDTLGTLVGVGSAGKMLDEKGNFPEIEKPMTVDALSCIFSALLGSSTSGAYIESAAGIKEGARTGLAALVIALLFALSLFFLPVIEPLQHLRYAYCPALMAVGVLMLSSVRNVDLDDLTETVPAFMTIAMMLFSYNIANGLTAGLVLYPVLKILTGRGKELHPGALVLGVMCLVYFLFGIPH